MFHTNSLRAFSYTWAHNFYGWRLVASLSKLETATCTQLLPRQSLRKHILYLGLSKRWLPRPGEPTLEYLGKDAYLWITRVYESRIACFLQHHQANTFDYLYLLILMGPPWWLNGKESARQCRTCGLHPWVRKIPWRNKWQPTPVFLPGKSHGQRN